MATSSTNVSFDGSPVQFRLDSPLLVCFDPLALDIIRDSMPGDARFDIGRLLTRVNSNHSAMSCYRVNDFRPGIYTLDPRDIRKFGDEDSDLDYMEGDQAPSGSADHATRFPFVAVDSAALIVADSAHLPHLAGLLSWEQYDLGLQHEEVFTKITEALGGPYFAVISGGCMPGMEFDGDGTYTIPAGRVRPSRG